MKLMRVPDQICHTSITSDEYALLFCMQLVVNIHWELHDEIHAHLQWLLWSEWSKLECLVDTVLLNENDVRLKPLIA